MRPGAYRASLFAGLLAELFIGSLAGAVAMLLLAQRFGEKNGGEALAAKARTA